MTQQIPAAWYPDPEQPGMQRYWDGVQWTEHRAPLHQPAAPAQQPTQAAAQTQAPAQSYPGSETSAQTPAQTPAQAPASSQGGYGQPSSTSDQLTRAGQDLADGVASAFSKAGTWVRQRGNEPRVEPPTFLQIAAGCSDDAPKEPLDRTVEATVGPDEVDPARRVFAEADTPITSDGATVEKVAVRLVPNPWHAADPGAVAVLAGPHQVATLPRAEAAEYREALVEAIVDRRLVAATATLHATYDGSKVSVTATVRLPLVSALSGSTTDSSSSWASSTPATGSSTETGTDTGTGSAGGSFGGSGSLT